MDVLTFEAERGYLDFKPLAFSQLWSDSSKRGQNVAQADITRAYFYVKTTESATNSFISLTDASSSQIEWLSGEGLRVKPGTNTAGQTRDSNVYELRFKMLDGSFIMVAKGLLHIKESIVDQPS